MNFFSAISCLVFFSISFPNGKGMALNDVIPSDDAKEVISWNQEGGVELRKTIKHERPYHSVRMSSLQHSQQSNPCRFKNCHPGRKCVIDGISGGAVCVCKRHCRKRVKPLCGSNGEYYTNRCEMHRQACLSGSVVYEALDKDCFHKRSTCDDIESFQEYLLEFHQTLVESSKDEDVESPLSLNDNQDLKKVEAAEVTTPQGDETDDAFAPPSNHDIRKTSITQRKSNRYDDVVTNDVRGDQIKLLFEYLDLDGDGSVGNDELYELILLEDLDAVLPPPCSLYNLLHSADVNHDKALDIFELLKIYNIAILNLPIRRKFVQNFASYGSAASMHCDIEGESSPIWNRNDLEIDDKNDYLQVDGAKVTIPFALSILAGNYTCHARKHPGLKQTIELSIVIKPTVQVYPMTQHRNPGSSATIFCNAVGVPTPSVSWEVGGTFQDSSSRFLLLENDTELHINSVITSDSATYSCLATNSAGSNKAESNLIVEENESKEIVELRKKGNYFVFHQNGITIIDPQTCQETRWIRTSEVVPGLLRQNKLCKATPRGEIGQCKWSEAVAVPPRLVYAAQFNENRVIVVDTELDRVIEVIATDPMPSSMYYVTSTDQLFIYCWNEWSRDRPTLLVVHAASIPGPHMAVHIQPLNGGNTVDFSILNFFVPKNELMVEVEKLGFVSRIQQQSIHKLNLSSLQYDDDVIDLRPYNCSPREFQFRPIGGFLDVTCLENLEYTPNHLIVDVATQQVISEMSYDRDVISHESSHMIRINENGKNIDFYKISESGKPKLLMKWNTTDVISDVIFVKKISNPGTTVAYISTANRADVVYVDPTTGIAQEISGTSPPIDYSQTMWPEQKRQLVASAWYNHYIATPGVNQFAVIDTNDNNVNCRVNDIKGIAAIVWAGGQL